MRRIQILRQSLMDAKNEAYRMQLKDVELASERALALLDAEMQRRNEERDRILDAQATKKAG